MNVQRLVRGSTVATIGFLLSPLSWWNDIIVNIPIAYAFGFAFGLLSKNFFLPAMLFGYWLTNISGLVLLHVGVSDAVPKKSRQLKEQLPKYFLISVLYSMLILVLAYFQILKFPLD